MKMSEVNYCSRRLESDPLSRSTRGAAPTRRSEASEQGAWPPAEPFNTPGTPGSAQMCFDLPRKTSVQQPPLVFNGTFLASTSQKLAAAS